MSGSGELAVGITSAGVRVPLLVNSDGSLATGASSASSGAFGNQLTVSPTPRIQMSFPYGIIPEIHFSDVGGTGATSAVSGVGLASTGANASSYGRLHSNVSAQYQAGLGMEALFTGIWPSPPATAGSHAYVGYLTPEDGAAFGFDGTVFGCLHRHNGQVEIRKLQITTAPTVAGDLDVELNGVTVSTTVLGTESIAETVSKIAAKVYAGWVAKDDGDHVTFVAAAADVRVGAYSFSVNLTLAAGTNAQQAVGVAPGETHTPVSAWTGTLPTLDTTKLNVFRIEYAYLGAGGISFFVRHPTTFEWVEVHKEVWGNAQTTALFGNPSCDMSAEAFNNGNAEVVTCGSSSMAAAVQGTPAQEVGSIVESTSTTTTVGAGATAALALVHIEQAFSNKTNRLDIEPLEISVSTDAGKPVLCTLRFDPVVVGAPAYVDIGVGVVAVAPAAGIASISGGSQTITIEIPASGTAKFPLFAQKFQGGTMAGFSCVTLGGGGGEVTVAMSWLVEF